MGRARANTALWRRGSLSQDGIKLSTNDAGGSLVGQPHYASEIGDHGLHIHMSHFTRGHLGAEHGHQLALGLISTIEAESSMR